MLGPQKEALEFLLAELIKADEPEAMLMTLRRICERMAHRSTRHNSRNECLRWQRLAEAVISVQHRLDELADDIVLDEPAESEHG